MGWWQKLLGIDAPPDATLQSVEPSLRGVFPWWIALALGMAAAALILFLYARDRTRTGLFRRLLMAGLRIAAVAFLLFLVLRPTLVVEYHGERPRGVVLLLDNSRSMTLEDHRLSPRDRLRVAIAQDLVTPETSIDDATALRGIPTPANPRRIDLVRAIWDNPRVRLRKGLEQHRPLRTFYFGKSVRAADESSTLADDLTADDDRTALADAILDILLRTDADPPLAIVAMTDGRDNASAASLQEAARECARLKVPLHIYGVGSAEGGTLLLKEVIAPEMLFANDNVSVPVRWRCQGFRSGTAEITLTLGGKTVARREVPVREGDDLQEVLTFTPEKGASPDQKLELAASIRLKERADVKDEIIRPVRLVDRKVKVLVIESSPRWEYKHLQAILLRDRRVDASFLLVNADPKALASGPPFLPAFPPTRKELFAYDLIILGDVPASYLGGEHMNWLREFVSNGGGLVQIAGRQHAPASYADTPLAELLPVEFKPVKFTPDTGSRPQEFHPVLTLPGERAEMLTLADNPEENLKVWKTLPGFYWHYPVEKLRPGATALLVHPKLKSPRAHDEQMPLLALHRYGRGLVLFAACEETWRWRFNAQERWLARFWGQVIYQLGLPHSVGTRRTQLALERSENLLDRPGYVYARLFDADFQPLTRERVPARLERLDAGPGEERVQTLLLDTVPGQPGEYRTLLANDVRGRFLLRVEGSEPASVEYRVLLPPRHELETIGMAEDALREAAQLSGGKFYREEDLHQLPADIKPAVAPFVQRHELLLWNPLAMLIFVCLVTAEWALRKFSNLS